jgi:hypothetical protein
MVDVVKVCLDGLGWVGLVWVGLGWVGLVWFGLVWFVSDNVRQVQWCLAFDPFGKVNLYNLAFAYFIVYIVWFGLV